MDPLLRQQIEDLREAGDAAQATILEVLVEVREQTTRTNGRVTSLENKVTQIGGGCPGTCNTALAQIGTLEARMDSIEKPAQTISILWKIAGAAAGHAVVILTLVAAFLATPFGEKFFEKKGDQLAISIEAQIEKTLAIKQAQTNPKK